MSGWKALARLKPVEIFPCAETPNPCSRRRSPKTGRPPAGIASFSGGGEGCAVVLNDPEMCDFWDPRYVPLNWGFFHSSEESEKGEGERRKGERRKEQRDKKKK